MELSRAISSGDLPSVMQQARVEIRTVSSQESMISPHDSVCGGISGRTEIKVLVEVQNMVKVIKYGPKRRVTCDVCGALLEFEKNDISTVQTGINEPELFMAQL